MQFYEEHAADAADPAEAAAIPASCGNVAALSRMGFPHIMGEANVERPRVNLSTPSQSSGGPVSKAEQAMLAYEHVVEIRLDTSRISDKAQA